MSKSSAKPNGRSDAGEGHHPDAASLDKVRDILFGKQARQSEKRFDGIEARLSREIDALRKDQEKSVSALRAEIEKRLNELGESLEGEKAERSEQVQAVEAELVGRIAELEASAEAAQEKLRAEFAEESQALRNELAAVDKRHAEVLGDAMTQLRKELIGRDQFAELLRDLAGSIDAEAGE